MSEKFENITIDYKYSDQIMVITLNRPPVNAFNQKLFEEISKAVWLASANEKICSIILRAQGKVFSAGADIKIVGNLTPQGAAIRRAALRKAASDLYTCPVPVVTAVQGGAIGVGALIAACGDIIVASEDAFFSIPEINHGMIGAAKSLWRMLPQQKIRTMALTGKRISSYEVYRLGGVEEVVTSEQLMDTAMKYAETIAEKGSLAVRMWKEALLVNEQLGPREGLLIEQSLSQDLMQFSPKPQLK
jgi:enoyl-CoA hydratase